MQTSCVCGSSTATATASLALRELLKKGYAGGFACGAVPLSRLDAFSQQRQHSVFQWTLETISLLNEGVSGTPLRMSDVAKKEYYRPQLILAVPT